MKDIGKIMEERKDSSFVGEKQGRAAHAALAGGDHASNFRRFQNIDNEGEENSPFVIPFSGTLNYARFGEHRR